MNPAQTAIREHVDAHYPEWRLGADRHSTRAGERYRGSTTARLLVPALEAVGLHVIETPRCLRVFVTESGKQVTREALEVLLAGAIAGHEDATLVASIGTAAFWEGIADRLQQYDGVVQWASQGKPSKTGPAKSNAEHVQAHRARKHEDEVASARAFVEAVRPRLAGQRIVAGDLYAAAARNLERKAGEPITDAEDSDFFTVPGPRTFYKVADEILGARYKAGGKRYYRVEAAA